MVQYQRKVTFRMPTGTALTLPVSGTAAEVLDISFSHNRAGGCEMADLTLHRQMGDYSIGGGLGEIRNGQQVEIARVDASGTTTAVWWRGFVDRLEFEDILGPLKVQAAGYGNTVLNEVFPMQVYGPGGTTTEYPNCQKTITNIGGVVKHLYDTYLATTTYGLTYGTVGGTTTNVNLLKMEGNRSLFDVLRDLAIMAGDMAWGVAETLTFFFRSLPATSTTYVADNVTGTNVALGIRYDKSIAETYNKLVLGGGRMANDEDYAKEFNDTASQALFRVRRTDRSVPEIICDSDAMTYANAFFDRYAAEHENVMIDLTGVQVNPTPWSSTFKIIDTLGAVITTVAANRVEVRFGEDVLATVQVGEDEDDPYSDLVAIVEEAEKRRGRNSYKSPTRPPVTATEADVPGGGGSRTHTLWAVNVTSVPASGSYNCTEIGAPIAGYAKTWSSIANAGDSILAANDKALLVEIYSGSALVTQSLFDSGNVWK